MTVRPATGADVLRMVDIVEALRAAVGGPVAVNRPWTAQVSARLIASPDAGAWVSGAGFIAGSLQPTVISPTPVAMEHGWWSSGGGGPSRPGTVRCRCNSRTGGPDLVRLDYRRAAQAGIK